MKALLLSQVPPCTTYTAGLVLKNFVKAFSTDEVLTVSIVNPFLTDAIQCDTLKNKTLRLVRPIEEGINPKLTRIPEQFIYPISRIREIYRRKATTSLIKKTVEFALKYNVDRIWAHLDSPYPIRMALKLAKILNLPLYTMVFDPPEWYLDGMNVDPWTKKEIVSLFDRAIKHSVCCATASEPMAEEYEKKYGAKCKVVINGLDLSLCKQPINSLNSNGSFRIGIAGQLYASQAWNCFLEYLDSKKWEIDNRAVSIRYLGRRLEINAHSPKNIEFLGWQTLENTIDKLAECDLLYCPYPFDPTKEEVSRLSFPSKMVSYLATAKPIFVHGPEYASVVKFAKKNKCGVICTELSVKNINDSIKLLFEDNEIIKTFSYNNLEILKENFSFKIMKKNLRQFLA